VIGCPIKALVLLRSLVQTSSVSLLGVTLYNLSRYGLQAIMSGLEVIVVADENRPRVENLIDNLRL